MCEYFTKKSLLRIPVLGMLSLSTIYQSVVELGLFLLVMVLIVVLGTVFVGVALVIVVLARNASFYLCLLYTNG